MILTPEQARAVYDAMHALNNIGARIKVTLNGDSFGREFVVFETPSGIIKLSDNAGRIYHVHANQAEFARYYQLDSK